MKRWLVPAVAMLVLSAGCASDIPPSSPVVPVPEVGQTETAAPAGDANGAATTETATGYFTALTSNDPDTMETGQKYAAPGSVAAAYLKHLTAVEGALLDGGISEDADELTTEPGTWGYCPNSLDGTAKCVKWADPKFADGKLVSFTVNDVDISKRLALGSGDKVKAGSLAEVTFLTAYQSVTSKSVTITFDLKAKKSVTLNLSGAKYRGPDGRQATATDTGGPDDLDQDSSARGYVAFKGAKPGGVVTLDLYDSDYNDHFVKIKTS